MLCLARVVLSSDATLMTTYRNVPFANFLGCTPSERVPSFLFNIIAPSIDHEEGVAPFAPYGGRKIEASLLRQYQRNEVVYAHPEHVEKFIDEDTRIVALSEMDPLGLGPVTMMFTMGGKLTGYSKKRFVELCERINRIRQKRNLKFKVVVGGPGTWQLDVRPETSRLLGVDHLIIGETEHVIDHVFQDIEKGERPEVIKIPTWPKKHEIPPIVNPSMQSIVEVMRGCGRNCEYCDPNLRAARYMDHEKILDEVEVNVKGGISNVWLHSEDVFLYQLEDHKNFMPNRDALVDLFRTVISAPGVTHLNPTHGTIAPAAADPQLIKDLSFEVGAGPRNWIGIQPGLETGSPELVKKYMHYKAKPFSGEEWQDVVMNGTYAFNENYWFPAYTLIIGLPGETEDDTWETVRLIDKLEKQLPEKLGNRAHFTATPLSFVPIGILRDKEFFDIEGMVNEARFALIYRCWRHSVLEAERFPQILEKISPAMRLFMSQLVKRGSRSILWFIERWGKKLGYDPEKALRVN
ncbi:MAG: B12-binding domain-containing radical SAM protein [Candidatus Bathyarchaeia archaeon]